MEHHGRLSAKARRQHQTRTELSRSPFDERLGAPIGEASIELGEIQGVRNQAQAVHEGDNLYLFTRCCKQNSHAYANYPIFKAIISH